jgi:hypothetical protein
MPPPYTFRSATRKLDQEILSPEINGGTQIKQISPMSGEKSTGFYFDWNI